MPPINDDLTKYGSVFQTKIITSLLTDATFAVTVYDMIQPELMGTEAKQWLVKSIKEDEIKIRRIKYKNHKIKLRKN